MRWLLLYSIVLCLGLDGRDICLQHLVSGSGSLQLQDAENLSLCSYHEFFEQALQGNESHQPAPHRCPALCAHLHHWLGFASNYISEILGS
jgi:hypothetical protein